MANRFFWYELVATDVAAAKAFYTDVVGWTAETYPGSDYIVLKTGERGQAGLMALPGATPGWSAYVYVEGVDHVAAAAVAAGGRICQPPSDIPTVGRFAVLADPQGATFKIMRPLSDEPMPPLSVEGELGGGAWAELHSSDWERGFDFYAGLFGWTRGTTMDMGPMGTYQLFQIDGVDKGGMMNAMVSSDWWQNALQEPAWLTYFRVADIHAAGERIVAGGGKILHGPADVPGGMKIIQASDPAGVMFALVG